MKLDGTYFTSAEIAGPGFLNFRLGDKWYADVMDDVEREGGRLRHATRASRARRYMVEFVSANPTGPMHMGNARGGVLGDTLASVLRLAGANVWREFYVNDAGNQIDKFARVHRGPLPPAHQGRGRRRLPRGRLPWRRHQGAGRRPSTPSTATSCLDKTEAERQDDLAQLRPRPSTCPKMKSDLERYRHRVRRMVLRVLPARERLCRRDGGNAHRPGLDL